MYDWSTRGVGYVYDGNHPLKCEDHFPGEEDRLTFSLDLDYFKIFVGGNNPEVEGDRYKWYGNFSNMN